MIAKLFLSQILLDNFLIHLEVLLAWFVNTLVNVFWLAEFFFLFAFLLLFLLSKQFMYNTIFYTNYMKPKLVTVVEDVHITTSRRWTLINTKSTFNIAKLTPMSALSRRNRRY